MRDLTLTSGPLSSTPPDKADSNKPNTSGLSSSDGDDPPQRLPHQAGFVTWSLLAAILSLFVTIVACWAAVYEPSAPVSEWGIAQQAKSGYPRFSFVGGILIANIAEDGENQFLLQPSVIVSFAKNKRSGLIYSRHRRCERRQAVGFVRSCIIWMARQFDSLCLADRAVDQPSGISPAIPERNGTGYDPRHVWADLDTNLPCRYRHDPRALDAALSHKSGAQNPSLYQTDDDKSASVIIKGTVWWDDYGRAVLCLIAGFVCVALGCILWIDWDCWVGGVPLLFCGYVFVQTAEFTARHGWGDVWNSWAWLWTRGA
jgi:hypothetical protein